MKVKKFALMFFLVFFIGLGLSGVALAKDDVGSVVAVRGKAVIDREHKTIEAKVSDGIFINDAISTLEASRVKMLFIDDSVLTLGEKSKMVVKELFYSKVKIGESVFNLVDGKMRAIVGKTNFEVHTPTAVAAARGTAGLFETGIKDGKRYTTIICLEGEFQVSIEGVEGSVTLTPGMMITIFEGDIKLVPVTTPAGETDRLLKGTDIGYELSIPGPAEIKVGPGGAAIQPAGQMGPTGPAGPAWMTGNSQQQPLPKNTTPVNINVNFPGK
jgi:hypothetical protein